MRKLTKNIMLSISIALCSIMMAFGLVSVFTPNKVLAQESVTPATAEFTVDVVQIRLGLDEENNFDYAQNGIKFLAKMDAETYTSIKDIAVFGLMVMPYDYLTDGAFNKANVTFEESTAKYDGKVVAFGETAEMTLSDDAYYMSATMTNVKQANKTKNFVAIPYLKSSDAEGKIVYDFKNVSEAQNMTNLAKNVVANNTTLSNEVKFALRDAYDMQLEDTDSAYTTLAGTYTNTYVVNADKTITFTNLNEYDTYGHNTESAGSYVLYSDGAMKVTIGEETLYGSYDAVNGKFTIDGVESVKVDIEALNKILTYNETTLATGAGVKYKRYGNNDYKLALANGANQGINFLSETVTDSSTGLTYNCYVFGYGWRFNYKLIPITETFGKIETTFVTISGYSASNSTHVNQNKHYKNQSYGEIYYVVNSNNQMSLKLSDNPVFTDIRTGIAYGHFIDLYETNNAYEHTPYDTTADFNKLAGTGGTTSAPVSKTYTNGTASLTLENDGELKLSAALGVTTYTFMGAKAVFNDGANQINATYNLIAISSTNGKIFIDMAETPCRYKDATDKSRYVVGDYVIDNGTITIDFSYAGIQYTLTCNA